jgi:hypothetical protein
LTVEQIRVAIPKLERRIADLDALNPDQFSDFGNEADKIAKRINATLVDVFGHDTIEYNEYEVRWASFVSYNANYELLKNENIENFRRGTESTRGKLQTIVDILRERLTDLSELSVADSRRVIPAARASSTDIFIVHGRDDAAREEVARFVSRAGLNPIILHEQASGGRTVIEKLEHYSNVGFAVVLLTPDDEGNPVGGAPQPRARQNVIAELFYFVGKLGNYPFDIGSY